jgi:hypothetical protein
MTKGSASSVTRFSHYAESAKVVPMISDPLLV